MSTSPLHYSPCDPPGTNSAPSLTGPHSVDGAVYVRQTLQQQIAEEKNRQILQLFINELGDEEGRISFDHWAENRPARRVWRQLRNYPRLRDSMFGNSVSLTLPCISDNTPVQKGNSRLYFERIEFQKNEFGEHELRVSYEPVTVGNMFNKPWIKVTKEKQAVKDGDLSISGLDCAVSRRRSEKRAAQISNISPVNESEIQSELTDVETDLQEASITKEEAVSTPHQLPTNKAEAADMKPIKRKFSIVRVFKTIIQSIKCLVLKFFKWFASQFKDQAKSESSNPDLKTKKISAKPIETKNEEPNSLIAEESDTDDFLDIVEVESDEEWNSDLDF